MHDLFYSEEQYREYQDDLMGDGYSNEYQRVHALSAMERPLKDERAEAARLHARGRFVVCAEWEWCCPYTDGLIGYDWVVLKDFETELEAREYIGLDPEDREEGVFLYQPPVERLQPSVVDETDEIPF